MRFVPIYVAVETDDDAEAIRCARIVAEATNGEAFDLRCPDDARSIEKESTALRLTESFR